MASPTRTQLSRAGSIRRSNRTGSPGSRAVSPAYGQPQQPQWTPQPPVARKPAIVAHAIPVVTMDILPGEEIAEVVGDVIGVVARTRELRPDLRNGNPVDGYMTMLTESRQDAVTRLVEMAQTAGADAVVGTAVRLQRDHPVPQ